MYTSLHVKCLVILIRFRLKFYLLDSFAKSHQIFLLLYLCILIIMYVLLRIFCFHPTICHSSATLTEVFPCFFLSKGKSVPLQAWSGPEGSRNLRFPDFTTTAQEGGKVVSLTHRPYFTPRKSSWYSFLLEAESTPRAIVRSEELYH